MELAKAKGFFDGLQFSDLEKQKNSTDVPKNLETSWAKHPFYQTQKNAPN
jgi:hypothetical protein